MSIENDDRCLWNEDRCLCRRIGGSDDSVMGPKTSWTVKWHALGGRIFIDKVMALDIKGAMSELMSLRGMLDARFILSIRKD